MASTDIQTYLSNRILKVQPICTDYRLQHKLLSVHNTSIPESGHPKQSDAHTYGLGISRRITKTTHLIRCLICSFSMANQLVSCFELELF